MSYITTVLLLHSGIEEYTEDAHGKEIFPIHERLNAFFEYTGFRQIDGDLFGGTKYPTCVLLAGAFNYIDLDGLCAHMRGWTGRTGRRCS